MSIKRMNGVTCVLSCDGRSKRHNAQKPVRSGGYSTGQKHCQDYWTFIDQDWIFCPCCEQKLKTRRRNIECKSITWEDIEFWTNCYRWT
jgi:hypothetical protein